MHVCEERINGMLLFNKIYGEISLAKIDLVLSFGGLPAVGNLPTYIDMYRAYLSTIKYFLLPSCTFESYG